MKEQQVVCERKGQNKIGDGRHLASSRTTLSVKGIFFGPSYDLIRKSHHTPTKIVNPPVIKQA